MAIYGHPDDPEVSCGGTLARWAAAGAAVHIAIVNQGDKGSSDPATDPRRLAAERAAETRAAATELGVASVTMFDIPDGESENDMALRARIVELVRHMKPDVVVCPDPTVLFYGDSYVNHRDHRVCGAAVLDAVTPAAASPLYFPDAGPPHVVARIYLSASLEADTAIDISSVMAQKAGALAQHRSQVGLTGEWIEELVEQRATEAGRTVRLRHAEAFRVLRLA